MLNREFRCRLTAGIQPARPGLTTRRSMQEARGPSRCNAMLGGALHWAVFWARVVNIASASFRLLPM